MNDFEHGLGLLTIALAVLTFILVRSALVHSAPTEEDYYKEVLKRYYNTN